MEVINLLAHFEMISFSVFRFSLRIFFNNHPQLTHQSRSISITLEPFTLFTRLSWLLFKGTFLLSDLHANDTFWVASRALLKAILISIITCDSWATHINLLNKSASTKKTILRIYLFILHWFFRRLLCF